MSRNIQVIAMANRQPDTRLYVLALIALARQLQEEAEPPKGVDGTGGPNRPSPPEARP